MAEPLFAGRAPADVFVLDSTGPTVRPQSAVAVKDDQIEYRLPPLSATLFVCRP